MVKGFARLIFAVTLIIVSVGLIVEMKYDVSLNKYLAYSAPLTQEEKEYLKEKDTLVFYGNINKEPYLFENKETGKIDGLLADYIKFLSADMRINIKFKEKTGNNVNKKFEKNEIDFTDVIENSNVNNSFSETQSIYGESGVIVTKYESEIKKLRDLNGQTLALTAGEMTENAIEEILPQGGSVKLKYVNDAEEGLELLMKGKVQAFVGNKLVIDNKCRELNIQQKIKHIEEEVYKGKIVFAINVYDTKLCNIMNKEIIKLKRQRLYGQLQEEWLGATSIMGTGSTSVRWAQLIISFCVGIVILLMIWESVLNRRIDQKTKQINIEKKNLQTVIDNISALVAVINKKGDIVTCNEFGKEMLNYDKIDFIGCNINTVKMLKELHDLYNENPDKPFYFYNDRYYQTTLRRIGQNENNNLLMISDCTEQIIAEQKVRQESKMIAVGQLSAGLAHEIRNPLGLIKTYSYLLQDYSTDEMSEHSLKVIGDSVRRIDNLIENLLNFSRSKNDKASKINITHLTNNIIELGRKTFEKENVKITLKTGKEIVMTTIEEPLKIVIYNLINNAVEAFKEAEQSDGEIIIEQTIDNGMLKIIIRDNGPGMSEDTVENIFNPFFTTKDTGTGLGLYIVITELKKINGQISVKSSLNKGTEFIVEIPAR